MAWRIDFTPGARNDLRRLDRSAAARILSFLEERVASHPDPRYLAKPLRGQLRTYYRYRVGDYRIIADIQGDRLVVQVVKVGHRREVYD